MVASLGWGSHPLCPVVPASLPVPGAGKSFLPSPCCAPPSLGFPLAAVLVSPPPLPAVLQATCPPPRARAPSGAWPQRRVRPAPGARRAVPGQCRRLPVGRSGPERGRIRIRGSRGARRVSPGPARPGAAAGLPSPPLAGRRGAGARSRATGSRAQAGRRERSRAWDSLGREAPGDPGARPAGGPGRLVSTLPTRVLSGPRLPGGPTAQRSGP